MVRCCSKLRLQFLLRFLSWVNNFFFSLAMSLKEKKKGKAYGCVEEPGTCLASVPQGVEGQGERQALFLTSNKSSQFKKRRKTIA